MTENNEKRLNSFVKNVEKKFEKYFIAYGVKKYKNNHSINIIIDDRDVKWMEKEDLRKKINDIFKLFLKDKQDIIKAKTILVSDLNESNIWDSLGQKAVIFNTKATTSFVKIKIPSNFIKIYRELPQKFKLSDFSREINKSSKKIYHRNTYQNWLKALKTAGFLKLKDKTYYKIEGPYKKTLMEGFN